MTLFCREILLNGASIFLRIGIERVLGVNLNAGNDFIRFLAGHADGLEVALRIRAGDMGGIDPQLLPDIFSQCGERQVRLNNCCEQGIRLLDTGIAAGYFMLRELDSPCAEFTHVIIGRKGLGYGSEALKLLLKWTFEIKKFHRVWIDCKEYNSIALHLYERLGFIREGVLREYLLTNGVYENLIVLGMLAREYFNQL